MKKKVLTILILSFLIGNSQSNIDCNKLLNQKIDFSLLAENEIKTVKENFSKLNKCEIGNITNESISNISILISVIEPMIQKEKQNITYRDIYKSIILIQQFPEYDKVVDAVKASNELAIRKVSIINLNKDLELLKKMELSEKTNEGYIKYLKENIDTTKTYKEIYDDYQEYLISANFNEEPSNYKLLYKNTGVINLKKLISKAKKENKLILIYFNGYACVNARKMEERVIEKGNIKNIMLENFVFENVYVDNQTKLPIENWHIDEETGKLINKVGMKNHQIQVKKFKSNMCPLFVIMDKFGNKIRHQEYTTDIKEFKDFLISPND